MTSGKRAEVICNLDPLKWDDFVAQAPGGNHLQTSQWAEVKKPFGWEAQRILIQEDNKVLAGAQIFQRSLARFGKIAYITKGPLFARLDLNLAERLLFIIRKTYCQNRLVILSIQPANNAEIIEDILIRMGFRAGRLELAPTASVILDLCEDSDKIFRCATETVRRKVRKSRREGITCREGGKDDLPAFYQLYLATGRRHSFIPYPEEYFLRMWRVFAEAGSIALLLAHFQGEPVSGILLIGYRDTVTMKYLGWSGKYSELCPNHALLWYGIEWSKAKGYQFFDFEGVDRESAKLILNGQELPEVFKKSHDFFKFTFGGRLVLYPQTYDWIPNPLFRSLYQFTKPTMDNQSASSKVVEWLRKRGSFSTN